MNNLWILDISINVNLKKFSYEQNSKVEKYNYLLAKNFLRVKKHFFFIQKVTKIFK